MRFSIALISLTLTECFADEPSGPFQARVADTALDPALGVGLRAPEIQAKHLSGQGPITLAAAHGKIVIVDFFASWCLPCKRSFPSYQRLVEQFPDDVAVVAVSMDARDQIEDGAVRQFVTATRATFPVLWDQDGKTAAAYRPTRMPSAFVIGRDGVIRSVHVGYDNGEDLRIASDVRMMIGK